MILKGSGTQRTIIQGKGAMQCSLLSHRKFKAQDFYVLVLGEKYRNCFGDGLVQYQMQGHLLDLERTQSLASHPESAFKHCV